jgi:hypothetical protein
MFARYSNEPIEKLGLRGIDTRDFDESLVAAFEDFISELAMG